MSKLSVRRTLVGVLIWLILTTPTLAWGRVAVGDSGPAAGVAYTRATPRSRARL